jgi:hypothetical protein
MAGLSINLGMALCRQGCQLTLQRRIEQAPRRTLKDLVSLESIGSYSVRWSDRAASRTQSSALMNGDSLFVHKVSGSQRDRHKDVTKLN